MVTHVSCSPSAWGVRLLDSFDTWHMFEFVVLEIVGNNTGTIGSDNGFGDIAIGHQEADARFERDDPGLKWLDARFTKNHDRTYCKKSRL